jgi:DNA-binding NtrC family response regulator
MDNPEHLQLLRADQTVVLIVDDDPMIRNITRIALEGEGHFILSAADGQEALLQSRKFTGTIHLVLSDVTMPNMNGLQLRDRLGQERPATKVLLMSGQQVDLPVEQPFLWKPFGLDGLRERVRQALTHLRSEAAHAGGPGTASS